MQTNNKIMKVVREIDTELISVKSSNFIVNKNIACFDIDGTIIKTKSGAKFAKDKNDWVFLYDNTKEILKKISKNYNIVFMSNQGGIGKGKQTANDWCDKISDIIIKINLPICAYAAPENNKYRKPSIGMWHAFAKEYGLSNDLMEQSFYCGDAGGRIKGWKKRMKKDFSDSDRKFAMNLGLTFYSPEELFLGEEPTKKWELKGLNPSNIPDLIKGNKLIKPEKIIRNEQQLIINVGFPGSGKSTFSKQFIGDKWIIANQDTCKTSAKCLKLCKEGIINGKSIIIDNTNPDKKTRKKYIDVAKSINKNIHITCLHFTTPMEIAQHNNKYRNFESNNKVKRIPDMVYYIFRKKLEIPEKNEGINKIIQIPFVLNNAPAEYFNWF